MSQVTEQICTIVLPSDCTLPAGDAFEQEVRDAISGMPSLVLLNCQYLDKVVSSHVRLLWSACEMCRDSQVNLRLSHPTTALMRILRTLDLVDSFQYEGTDHYRGQRLDQDLGMEHLPSTFADTVHPTIDDIDASIARFMSFLADVRVSATTLLELRTIFYEIATNIRFHSGVLPQDQFNVDAHAELDCVTMTFADSGVPFDPTVGTEQIDAVAAARQRKQRGFGLIMVRRLADGLSYHRNPASQNVLTITKKWYR